MRNSEEFRRLVFEKAENYEKRRKARRRKIMNSALICSLVLALCIPAAAYLYQFHSDAIPTEETTTATQAHVSRPAETTQETLATTTEATFATTTAAMTTTPLFTTEMTFTETWTMPETTVATTATGTGGTTTVEATTEETTATVAPCVIASGMTQQVSNSEHNFDGYSNPVFFASEITSEEALTAFLDSNSERYGFDTANILSICDEDFFQTKKIVYLITNYPYSDRMEENGNGYTAILSPAPKKELYCYLFSAETDIQITAKISE